jgi:hypothetical protein
MRNNEEKKIGLIIGREWSWPSAFITEVNKRGEGVTAEFVKLGGTFLTTTSEYDVIIDRMSHEIPYYRTYLKYAAMQGAYIINNPFTWAADDQFIGFALAERMGYAAPRTVVLPNKRVETQVVPESFRNLKYPMDWRGIIDYVGVPAVLKDAATGGRRLTERVHDVDELIQRYDESDTLTVLVQETLEEALHVHCFVFGQTEALAVPYSPDAGGYLPVEGTITAEIMDTIREQALALTKVYGYDMNLVEFAVREETAYVVNASNPAPDMDINLLKPLHFSQCVTRMADFAIERALQPESRADEWGWQRFRNPRQ